jgi:hypothetical protein
VSALKAKIGYPTLAEDLAVLHAIRSAIRPDVHLMVDYNQCLDLAEARRRLHVLDDEDLVLVEEPVSAHDFLAMAALARQIRTPLEAGANWWGPRDFATAVVLGSSDHLMPDHLGRAIAVALRATRVGGGRKVRYLIVLGRQGLARCRPPVVGWAFGFSRGPGVSMTASGEWCGAHVSIAFSRV